MERKRTKVLLTIALCALVIGALGISYAYFIAPIISENSSSTKVVTGKLNVTMSDTNLSISQGAPIYDEYANIQAYSKDFTLTNNGSLGGSAKLSLEVLTLSDSLKSNYFKYRLINNNTGDVTNGNFSTATAGGIITLVDATNIPVSTTVSFTLKIWISYQDGVDQNNMMNTTFSGRVIAETKDYKGN